MVLAAIQKVLIVITPVIQFHKKRVPLGALLFFGLTVRKSKYNLVIHFCGNNLRGGQNETPDDIPPVCVRNAGMQ